MCSRMCVLCECRHLQMTCDCGPLMRMLKQQQVFLTNEPSLTPRTVMFGGGNLKTAGHSSCGVVRSFFLCSGGSTCVELRRQLAGISSFLHHSGSRDGIITRLDGKCLYPTRPSHWTLLSYFFKGV